MSDISCGKVTIEERDEIKKLFQRKTALAELFAPLAKLEDAALDRLYEKVIIDIGKTSTEFHNWWEQKAKQYAWDSIDGGNWRIDFDTCEVFLVQK
jgi:CXXX repeat modification system protein